MALIVENAGEYCGISYIPEDPTLSYKDFAYIVVGRNCGVSNLSFAHETGHILGARHDLYVDPTEDRPLGKNHGIIFKCGTTVEISWPIIIIAKKCFTLISLALEFGQGRFGMPVRHIRRTVPTLKRTPSGLYVYSDR